MSERITAGVILIGNELLSGRVQDANLTHIARELGKRGILVRECRVIPDTEQAIIDAVHDFRTRFNYVFTTGGIGPTHDDITMPTIAKAFGRKVVRDENIARAFEEYFGDRLTDATLRMADFPEGAVLVKCPATIAPGFRVENVFVMAGIPRIMRAMMEAIIPQLPQGQPIMELTYTAFTSEGKISFGLEEIQNKYPNVDLGSYPFLQDGRSAVSLVARSFNTDALQQAGHEIRELLENVEAEMIESPTGWPEIA